MLFNSYIFILVFLPLTIGIFALFQKFGMARMMTMWLVLCSLFFYGWWNPIYLVLLGGSIAVNFYLGRKLSTSPYKSILISGITFNLGLLAYFKYAGFFASVVGMGAIDIILPLAISFFTFQQITYLIDAYKGEAQEYNFLDYCLFITFFPQLIAGPIVHHKEMMPQFADKKIFGLSAQNLAIGLTFFVIGLFKKVVIADQMAEFATPVFNAADSGNTVYMIEAWVAALAYTFQLYFDFSGYSDMAIGLARMFGIQLPLNFFSPYKSASIIDFWRRWHMTLSRFLRDYLYIPLGGNRKGRIRRYQNLMITMLLGGLWHGAGWNFIIWGGLHGLYLVINNAWRWVCNRLNIKPFDSFFGNITAIIITFLSVVIAWVFFRATSLNGAMSMISAMLGLNGISIESDMNQHVTNYIEYLGFKIVDIGLLPIINMDFIRVMTFIIPTMIIAFLFPNTAQFMRDTLRTPALKDFHALHLNKYNLPSLIWTSNFIMMVAITFMAILAFLSLTRVSEFLYFQF